MAENSKIEWCDHTFNPWIGCTKVSPGCLHCYAETRSKRTDGVVWGKGQQRKRTSEGNWKLPLKWNREAGAAIASFNESEIVRGTLGPIARPRVFCASLADWLDDEVPIEWLKDLLVLIQETPHLDWLLLTKRPENFTRRIAEVATGWQSSCELAVWWERGVFPLNVWIGTTAEDQTRAEERIPHLLEIPAKVRFLSCEPLLGPINMEAAIKHPMWGWGLSDGIHWMIAGGESGPGARPMHPDWARSLRDQCQVAGVPFLFKQWGEWHESDLQPRNGRQTHLWADSKLMYRFGKKAAGRLLDGVEHNGFPVTTEVSRG